MLLLLLSFPIYGPNNRIVTSSLLPKLAFSRTYKCAKICKSGMAYFYEFDVDTWETSRTIYAVFTRFTRHQIERFPRHICCLNKSIGKV